MKIQKNFKNKIQKIILVSMFLIMSIVSFTATGTENLNDYKALLVGDSNGKITKANNIYAVRSFASITKLMTSLLVLEKVKTGEMSLSDQVYVSSKAASVPYGIKLVAGNHYTVRDLLKATIIRSSNNAAYALGEHLGNGNMTNFVNMMNEKARDLGLTSLRYCSPHGLPPSYTGSCMDQGNALDLYKLATLVVQYDEYLNISKNARGSMSDGTILKSTNNLLENVRGVDGLKTGYHNAAGSNIILTAKRGSDRVIVVILGSQKAKNRDAIGEYQIENYYSSGKKDSVLKVDPLSIKNSKKVKETKEVKEELATKLNTIKVVDRNDLIDTRKINGKVYGLYSSESIFASIKGHSKPELIYEMSLQEKITKNDDGKVVGTFIAKDNENNIYTGAVILKEIK